MFTIHDIRSLLSLRHFQMNLIPRWAAALSLASLLLIPACTYDDLQSYMSPDEEKFEELELKHDEPIAAATFRYFQRLSADGTIPDNALMKAKAQRDALASRSIDGGGVNPDSWTWAGPGNIGGRLRAIVVDPTNPNIAYIGSASGGIWKTTNAGSAWTPLDDFLPSLSIGCMTMDPANPNILYAGTGEGFFDTVEGTSNTAAVRGAGIFKSTDAGATWNQLTSTAGADWYFVNRVAIHPTNSQIMLAATNTGLMRTTDGGNTWSNRLAQHILDVRLDPNNPSNAVLGGHHDVETPYYSNDGGQTWTAATGISSADRIELSYAPSTPGMVYAAVSLNGSIRVWRSTDGGRTYALRTGSGISTYASYNNVIWVDPTNSETIVIGGVYLYRSTNGGTSNSRVFSSVHADQHVITNHPTFDGVNNRIVYFGHDGGLSRTDNVYASSTVNLNNNLGITQFYGAAVNNASGVIVGGTQDNGTLRYSGNPQGWTSTFGGDGGYCASDPTDPNYFYGEVQRAFIFRSTNGGQSASYIYSGIGDAGGLNSNFIPFFLLDPNDPNRMLVGCRSLWRSNNVKASTPTWTAIKPPIGGGSPGGPGWSHFSENSPYNIATMTIKPGDPNTVWVGYNNGEVWYTINGTSTLPDWTRIDNRGNPALPDRWISTIAVDPSDPSGNTIYVALMGWEPDNLWKGTAPHTSWTRVTGNDPYALPSTPLSALALHPSNPGWIYVGSDIGIFTSNDAGNTWSVTTQGPGTVPVEQLIWRNPSTLMAVTHGRGIFLAGVSNDPILSSPTPGIAGVDNTFTVTECSPGQTVYFVYGLVGGSTNVPGCPGVTVAIRTPTIFGSATADPLGVASIQRFVPAAAANRTILFQCVDRSSCRVSNLVQFTFN